jgi:tRNA pseudouridine38-40 synthase
MNAHLPSDIAVLDACEVPADFHARYAVISKEYEYVIYNGRERNPFFEGRAWHVPTPIDDAALAEMQAAAAHFVGKQDFSAFRAVGADTAPKDAVRHVMKATVTREGDVVSFRVQADGFLYNMVRIITGTLVEVGLGKRSPESLKTTIESRDRQQAGHTAPPQGLYLKEIYYDVKEVPGYDTVKTSQLG